MVLERNEALDVLALVLLNSILFYRVRRRKRTGESGRPATTEPEIAEEVIVKVSKNIRKR